VKFFGRNRIEPFLDKIDNQRLREIQRRYANSSDRYAKYADVEHWLKINLPRVQELKLDRSPPKEVLDLGCGAGFSISRPTVRSQMPWSRRRRLSAFQRVS
jgi:2-polyprenyl-3-methyl-5-hydroxy-6-metoxy-1,4-benzoquinol methylase